MFRSRLAWMYLLTVALGWLLGDWMAERTLLTLLLAYAPPVVWLLPAPLVLLWTWFKRRGVGTALLGTLLALWGAGFLHWRAQSDGELRVLTYNVLSGRNTTPERLASQLKAVNADVILLQEARLGPAFKAALLAGLPGYTAMQASEVITVTRLPVASWEGRELPGISRELLVTHLTWKGQPLNVVNVHLGTVQVVDALAGDWGYLRRTRDARTAQVQVLRQLAAGTPGRLLLGGDLNTPPRGMVYRRLQTAYGPDAHASAGRGPGWTYPSLRVRIDHVLARGLTPTRTQVMPAWGSDHRALLVEYRLAE